MLRSLPDKPVAAGKTRLSLVGLVTTKGGSGKSSIASQLAIAAATAGRNVLVLDGDDSQNSIHVWASALRKGRPPAIRTVTYETIDQQLASARREGFDLAIIDVPPTGPRIVTRVASLVDHILIPVRATTFDLHAVRNTVDLLRDAADASEPAALASRNCLGKAAIVLNAVPTRMTEKSRADVENALATCGAGGIDIIATIAERAAFTTALNKGLGVVEDEPEGKAAEEILSLYAGLVAIERAKTKAIKKLGGQA